MRIVQAFLRGLFDILGNRSPSNSSNFISTSISQISRREQCRLNSRCRVRRHHEMLFPEIITWFWQVRPIINIAGQKIRHRYYHRRIEPLQQCVVASLIIKLTE